MLAFVVARVILNHMVQYSDRLDAAFAALADPTRRGILERLGRGNATISDLAQDFGMTLTGVKKHVKILESSGLVATRKAGRVRTCALGSHRLDVEAAWMAKHHQMLEARLDRLGQLLERTKGKES
jgi:DNA-binding transcriptional ArsR family regulator